MSVARKPRRIGPAEAPEPPAPATSAEAAFSLDDFVAGLSAGDLMDLDDASGGAITRMMAGEEVPVTLGLIVAVAWIERRKREPGLTFAQVRRMRPDALAGVLNALGDEARPKAP